MFVDDLDTAFATLKASHIADMDALEAAKDVELADLAAAKDAVIAARDATITQRGATITAQLATIAARDAEIVALKAQVLALQNQPDQLPVISIADISVAESGPAVFTIKLSRPCTRNIAIAYATANGTAISGTDYVGASNTITFLPGEVSKTVSIALLNDTAVEGNETFSLNLSNFRIGLVADTQAIATIISDDVVAPPSSFPDASTTGFRGTLTNYTGPSTVSTNGIVIENKTITGGLEMTGTNQIVRNCKILNGNFGVRGFDATNLKIENCTFIGNGTGNAAITIRGTATGNDITGYENGILVESGGPSVIKGNYIHGLKAGPEGHIDGISCQGGQDNILIEDNTIFASGTSSVFLKSDWGPVKNTTVNHNLCRNEPGTGGYAFPIYDYAGSGGPNTGIRITNNVMEPGDYTPYFGLNQSTAFISGNTDFATGAAVNV